METLARACQQQDVRSISGTPSWLLIFFERLLALRPDRPDRLHAVFPRLELVVHGGVNFTPYQHQFAELLRGSFAELREVYPASEGFFTIADRGSGTGMRLIVDNARERRSPQGPSFKACGASRLGAEMGMYL